MKSLILCSLLFFSWSAFTSKEGVLSTSAFSMESNGIGDSGAVLVRGKRSHRGAFESVEIVAFGKTFKVPSVELAKIPPLSNGIQLSYENGIRGFSGKTVYIAFIVGFVGNEREKFVLAVDHAGKVYEVDTK